VADNHYPDGALADEALLRLRQAAGRKDQPFFIAVGFGKPHLPFCAPKKYWNLYDRQAMPLAERQTPPDDAPQYAPQFGGELRNYAGIPKQGQIPLELQRTLIHGYYAAVSFMDAQVGRLLDELDRLRLTDNTVVVLWGDHGWHLGDHGMWCKHTNYEQAARIPLIVVAPGVPQPGVRTLALAESVDVYPTLCELAGLARPNTALEGQSLAPALRDPSAEIKPAIFHVYPRKSEQRGDLLGRAIRTPRYRLVEWKQPGAPADSADLELYDYQTDPGESRNLAQQRPEVVSELRALLMQQPEARPPLRAGQATRKRART
jgi:iduronate 2-sulfatase